MAQYVGVSFRRQGQIYYFLATPFVLSMHDMVLVKTEEGIGFGEIVALRDDLPEGLDQESVKPIYRPATAEDVEIGRENDELARDARKYCQKSMARMNLDMKLVDVEIYFDKSKMIFYFTAPGRVDFRELVKDLVRNYRTRIELRQIGVRHETQMIGALGNCGQMCCCRRYLRRFEPVTIKMAKDQNLFLNPAKISGVCGRLLCCLAYEKENYADFQRRAPKLGRRYMTTQGPMKTLRANMFRDSVSVLNEVGDELDFSLSDWAAMVLPDQPRMAARDDAPEDVPAELAALMDPEVRNKSSQSDRRTKPPRREQRSRPGGERPPGPRPDRADRSERPERSDRPDRPERSDRSDRPERGPSRHKNDDASAAPAAPAASAAVGDRPESRPESSGPPRERKEYRPRDKRRKPGSGRKDHSSKPSGQQ
ncbi:regulatory iron-sulfur-containing complex subunit RicT [Desulfomicrobium baculatum]|uniref:PSP1 domain protein n=1 Tax=Desulfomicrobium baculatum (strain DSM 4028 / VKM B-1378 / X) TaxID=525897 RepID=C7LXM2_DESBD|nr:regulatory iron-sulfur-containing complex subunit RicT [Desulfomicrobium baculatum]ACU91258.1 PSP1 domain protein [Desulfomicrobium baculatum DSM 4028]